MSMVLSWEYFIGMGMGYLMHKVFKKLGINYLLKPVTKNKRALFTIGAFLTLLLCFNII